MSLSGSIEDLPLLEILQVVSFCQKTGYLTVTSPQGDAGVVFRDGRVVAGYIWDVASAPRDSVSPADVRARLGALLERLVRLREGEFAFNLAERAPTSLGGRDLTGDTLADGINPEELVLELARKLDEDRRDTAATLVASFAEPQPEATTLASAPADDESSPARVAGVEQSAGPPAATEAAPAPPADGPSGDQAPLEELEIQEQRQPPEGPTVLLVDDEPQVCDTVADRLRRAGLEVRVARTVAEARRDMQRLSAARVRFLLVVDLGLPSEAGTSFRAGLDLVRLASGLPAPAPVLLMSEEIDEKLVGRARRLGVSLLAFKPGLSKLDPLQYAADLRAFGDKLARDLVPRLAGRRGASMAAAVTTADSVESRDRTLAAAIAEIDAHPDTDLVAFLLLRAARACFVRALLFVVKDDQLAGLAGFGPVAGGRSLDLLVREIAIPLIEPSPFAEVAKTRRAWRGALPDEGPLGAVMDSIGRLHACEAAILPLRAAGETLAMVYADAPDGTELSSVEPFAAFVERAGGALDAARAVRAGSAAR